MISSDYAFFYYYFMSPSVLFDCTSFWDIVLCLVVTYGIEEDVQ